MESIAEMTIERKKAIARSRNASPNVLRKLSKDADPEVRVLVACNAATPEPVLERLRKSPDREVRFWAICNEYLD